MPAMFRPAPLTMLTEGSNLSHGLPHRLRGYVRKLGAGAKAIPRGTVLVLTGVQEGKHQELLFKPASAATSGGHANPLYVAGEYIAKEYVDAADKDRQIYRNVLDQIVIDFDTTGANAGDYVYLTDAQATGGLNISLTPGTSEVAVGIVVVEDTTDGKVLIAPAMIGAKVAHLAEINAVPDLHGTMAATNTETYAEVTAGALYDGGTLIWSLKSLAGGATSKATDWVQVGTGAGTKFRINLDAAPTGVGKTVTFSYVIKPPAA